VPSVLIELSVFSALSRPESISSVYAGRIFTIYIYMKLIYTILVLAAVCLSGCSALHIARPSAEQAAVLDVTTTGIGLGQGARELNPLGFTGTTLIKLYYFRVLRPEYSEQARAETDRWLSSLFTGAAVNNVIQVIWQPNLSVSVLLGIVVGWSAYNSAEVADPLQ
jgi:hypothetical protein